MLEAETGTETLRHSPPRPAVVPVAISPRPLPSQGCLRHHRPVGGFGIPCNWTTTRWIPQPHRKRQLQFPAASSNGSPSPSCPHFLPKRQKEKSSQRCIGYINNQIAETAIESQLVGDGYFLGNDGFGEDFCLLLPTAQRIDEAGDSGISAAHNSLAVFDGA